MTEIGRFDNESSKNIRNENIHLKPQTPEEKKSKLKKIVVDYKFNKPTQSISHNEALASLNKIHLHNTPSSVNSETYVDKINKEETDISNILDRGKEPLKRPNEKPTFVMDKGPNGGKLEQFPQRANGTYRTIETLQNGGTIECTYSQTGILLNEIKRDGDTTQVITFNGKFYDRVAIFKDNIGRQTTGKIQMGIFQSAQRPTLQDVTGRPLHGFLIK